MTKRNNDCGCTTHDGPHFIYMDTYTREANEKLIRDALTALKNLPDDAPDAYRGALEAKYFRGCELEIIRLREKAAWMKTEEGKAWLAARKAPQH